MHNPQVVRKFEEQGIKTVDTVDEISENNNDINLVIRAHGVTKDVEDKARKKEFNIIDGTCPKVKLIFDLSQKAEKQGYSILLFGKSDHPEVKATVSRLNNYLVFNDIGELKDIPNKVCLLSQTTQPLNKFKQIIKYLESKEIDFYHHNTICDATRTRQISAEKLAKECDFVTVIGGKISHNTKELYNVCNKITKTVHIETLDELKSIDLEKYEKIGVTAGASTPDWIIDDVVDYLKSI